MSARPYLVCIPHRSLLLLSSLLVGCGANNQSNSANALPGPECAEPSGPGVEHAGLIDADETWAAADSPHLVTSPVTIQGATVTVEPCAVVRMRAGMSIAIDDSTVPAALVARGETVDDVERRIRFEREVEGEPWAAVIAYAPGLLDLEMVDLSGGGDPSTTPENGGTIIGKGAAAMGLAQNVRLVDVTVDESGTYGVNVVDRAGFTDDSRDVTITGAGSLPPRGNIETRYAMFIDSAALSTVPTGSYTGNAIDAIRVGDAGATLDGELTMRARGVPYSISGVFTLAPTDTAADGGLGTLVIEAGVEVQLEAGQAMVLGRSNGDTAENTWPVRLIAEGTADAPILLTTSAENPVAGAWIGLEWSGGPPSGNVMSHVRIEWAGGDGGVGNFGCGPPSNEAALKILNWRPEDEFISDSTFADSAAGGIVSGWSSDEDGPYLRSNNTFVNIANGCDVSRWADGDGSCPQPPPLCN